MATCQPAARNKFNALEYAGMSDSQNSDETTNITFDSLEYSCLTGEESFATVRIQGERGPYNLRCKVDTRAPTSVISKRIYRELYPNNFNKSGKLKPEAQIIPDQLKVKTCVGSELRQIGHVTTAIRHGPDTAQAQFLETETYKTPFLGLPSLSQLKLIKESCDTHCSLCKSPPDICLIKTPHKNYPVQQSQMSKDSLLRQYPECFKEIGALSGTYKIPTREDAVPCKDAPRSVPESQSEPLHKEL